MAVFGIVSSTDLLCPLFALAFPLNVVKQSLKIETFIDFFLQIMFKKDILTLSWYLDA